jgi:hypothetical protein
MSLHIVRYLFLRVSVYSKNDRANEPAPITLITTVPKSNILLPPSRSFFSV